MVALPSKASAVDSGEVRPDDTEVSRRALLLVVPDCNLVQVRELAVGPLILVIDLAGSLVSPDQSADRRVWCYIPRRRPKA